MLFKSRLKKHRFILTIMQVLTIWVESMTRQFTSAVFCKRSEEVIPRGIWRQNPLIWGLLGSMVLTPVGWSIEYFDPKEFQDPVADAQKDFDRGKYRIWGVLKDDQMRHPGLKASELEWVKKRKVDIEPKNRWAKYDSTPLPFDQALTMERYVSRYNASMLRLLRGIQLLEP